MPEDPGSWMDQIVNNRKLRVSALLAFIISLPIAVVLGFLQDPNVRPWAVGITLGVSLLLILAIILLFYIPDRRERLARQQRETIGNEVRKAMAGVDERLQHVEQKAESQSELTRLEIVRRFELSDERVEKRLAGIEAALAEDELRRAHNTLSRRYGWGYEKLSVSAAVSTDGSVELARDVTFRPTTPDGMKSLQQSMQLQLDSEKDIAAVTRDRVHVISQTPGNPCSVKNIYGMYGGWVIEVEFERPIAADSEGRFILTEKLKADTYSVGKTKQQLRDANYPPNDFFAWRLDRPTRLFEMTVHFPRRYKPDACGLMVMYLPIPKELSNARRHEVEEQKIAALMESTAYPDGRHSEAFSVELPILGMVYLIRWDPLTSD